MLKQVVTAVKMTPVTESVNIPFIPRFIDAERRLQPNDIMESAATAVLVELVRWTAALRGPRELVA